MLLTEFPNLQWLKREIETSFTNQRAWDGRRLAKPEWPNVIINTKSSQVVRDNIKGPLSLFSNSTGQSRVSLDNRVFNVGSDDFLISNFDQNYTLEVEGIKETETFNIHFSESFRQEVFNAIEFRDTDLLDPTLKKDSEDFVNRIQPKNKSLLTLMHELKSSPNPMHFEEALHKILLLLVGNERELNHTFEKIPLIKRSSKVEILKRLLVATDYIHSFSDYSLTLGELASIANLSKFHFLRLFKAAFKVTPHQYIMRLRIEKAKTILNHKSANVKEIALLLGFQNASSFSRLFKQQVGVYPIQFQLLS